MAPLTLTINDLFICQTGLAGRTPVNRHLLLIGESLLKHLNEYPLSPLIKVRICCIYFPIPVIDCCNLINLAFNIFNILCCRNAWMNPVLYSIILCRKSKCIPSHRMNQIISLHHLITAPCITDNIASPVTYMQTISRWIRKHIQTVVLRLLTVIYIDRMLFPTLSPLALDCSVIICDSHLLSS